MAVDFSKFNFFSRLNARSRIFVLIGVVVAFVFLIYFLTAYFSGGTGTTGPSTVANAPAGLQSVPGGQLTPEYYRALQAANAQAAKQAQITGTSAVPTLVRVEQPSQPGGCVICEPQNANVKNYLDQWVKEGKLTPDVAKQLQAAADANVPICAYAPMLDELVAGGKLTPEQARQLLEEYKRQHANALIQESGKAMDSLMKGGQLSSDVANQLLASQQRTASITDYAQGLRDLATKSTISAATAQQLLTQYTQQRSREITQCGIVNLEQMVKQGQLTPDVEKQLADLENRHASIDEMSNALDQLVKAGKITPAVAAKVLEDYKAQKAAMGPGGSLGVMLQKTEAAAYAEINDLLQAGKITQDVADELTSMIKANVSQKDYIAAVNALASQGKLTADIAKLKIADYAAVKNMREVNDRLSALQARNASPAEYADELKRLVQEGKLTPEQAAQLMQEYLAANAAAPTQAATTPVQGAEQFARLQQQIQSGGPTQGVVTTEEFATAENQGAVVSTQQTQDQINAIMASMANQAGQLINAWQPPTMAEKVGSQTEKKKEVVAVGTEGGGPHGLPPGVGGAAGLAGAPMIKAGAIYFAVLDTAVNSDYPDSPIMATIVEGKYKGARLLGKLTTTKSVAGQLDRVALTFSLMDAEDWPRSKAVTAYAIDPDTARINLASSVNYHYLKRFGAIAATSFLQGYANSITQAGTSTTGIFGTTTTHPSLAPGQKIAVALGQIGQTLGNATQGWINIPPTVRVDSGVSLGILFMADVS